MQLKLDQCKQRLAEMEKEVEAYRARFQFLRSISHELRTPLCAVNGCVSLLLETSLTSEQREQAVGIQMAGQSILRLVNNFNDFVDIETGRMKMTLTSTPFDLREAIESVLEVTEERAARKGITVNCLIASEVPNVIVSDPCRVRQVLSNLVDNAIRFTKEGEVIVSVTAGKQESSSEASQVVYDLHFSVKDTGIGVPSDRLEEMQQFFSQVGPGVVPSRACDWGLTVSKGLSDLLGGKLWVESEVGQGSTFNFTLRCEAR